MDNRGFTLIEIIIIIVVAGVVAGLLVPFLGSALTKSHEPLVNLERAAGLGSDMAKVVQVWDVGDVKAGYDGESHYTSIMNKFNSNLETILTDEGVTLADSSDKIKAVVEFQNTTGDEYLAVDLTKKADIEDCDNDPDQFCAFKVTLTGQENPGESVTYIFPWDE